MTVSDNAGRDIGTLNTWCLLPTVSITITAGTPSSITVPSSDVDGNLTINWGTSSTSGVTYVLEEATNSGFTSGLRTAYSGTGTNANITGRSNGVTYYYRVKATKSGYNNSAWKTGSNGCTVTFTTPTAGTPSSITVPSSDVDGNLTINWGTSSTSGVTYVLEEATNSGFTSGLRTAYSGTGASTNITGRSNGVTYYYRVKATKSGYNNSAWKTGSNGCTVTITPTAGTPSSISVPSSDSDGTYTVSWGTSSTSGVTYVLEEATNSGFTSGLRTAYSGTGASTNITGRSNGVTYYYRVKATKSGYNNSAWKTGSNGCIISSALSIVWVDFNYTGTESGTQSQPYNTLTEAINAVTVGGEIIIKSGVTSETFTGINKKVTIKPFGGTAVIGKQP